MIDWPATLPQALLREGFAQTLPENVLRSPDDMGPPVARRQYSAGYEVVEGQVYLTRAQSVELDDFYTETLMGGTLPFRWKNPLTKEPAVLQFAEEIEYEPRGQGWVATLPLIVRTS